MSVFRSVVFSAVLAGLIVGLVTTALQQFGTVPLILKGEVYEQEAEPQEAAAPDAGSAGHHEAAAWQPRDGWERNAYTALFNILEWIGFGLILTGAYVLAQRPVTWREGLLWGLCGFLVVTLAPSLGLPPELPGVPAAPLEPRQIWWASTVAATASGLALLAFTRTPSVAVLAVLLIAAPHLVGAPRLDIVETNVPEELSHRFVVAAMVTGYISWALLGSLTGLFYRRWRADRA